jgi:hypothetical protein
MSIFNNFCQYDPLEEVWVGDCYPEEFYSHYKPKVRETIEYIPIQFRTKDFWDAGVHCLTVDIRRTGKKRKIVNHA